MSSNLIIPDQFEQLLLKNWANIVDKSRLIRTVLEDAQTDSYKIVQGNNLASNLQVTITKFKIADNSKFEVWVEFSIPKDNSVIVGSHVYLTDINGNFELQNTYGTILQN